MYSTTDFRKGLKIEIDGTPFEIIEFQHFKPGKGGAMVRTKLRNILNGRVLDNTFRSGEKVDRPNLESRDMQSPENKKKPKQFPGDLASVRNGNLLRRSPFCLHDRDIRRCVEAGNHPARKRVPGRKRHYSRPR